MTADLSGDARMEQENMAGPGGSGWEQSGPPHAPRHSHLHQVRLCLLLAGALLLCLCSFWGIESSTPAKTAAIVAAEHVRFL